MAEASTALVSVVDIVVLEAWLALSVLLRWWARLALSATAAVLLLLSSCVV
jgi:hypothetical protein